MKIAIVGAGWAGLAAAVEITGLGHVAIVFEASRAIGGRARSVPGHLPDGSGVLLDNGQHILIGAYSDTLRLMRRVGVDPSAALLRRPLRLQFPDGGGLRFPNWPSPLDATAAIVAARGWRLADKLSLLQAAMGWQRDGFTCRAEASVAQLCRRVSPRVMCELIEPLCVSALNTPAVRASGQVFLRVMKDSLFGVAGGSNLLVPRTDLSALFPQAAAHWIEARAGQVRLGTRVDEMRPRLSAADGTTVQGWQVNGENFDAAILATAPSNSADSVFRYAHNAPEMIANQMRNWATSATALQFEAIATVYAYGPTATLPQPMLALRSHAEAPAQFVFDRGQLGGTFGLLAFVVSASTEGRDVLQAQVLAQARSQLGLDLTPVQTIVEKRATFACTPDLRRPPQTIAPGLLAAGDYCAGPYPATLEGAVRSGIQAGLQVASPRIAAE
jgi:hydroxysqualene dehydroxylase